MAKDILVETQQVAITSASPVTVTLNRALNDVSKAFIRLIGNSHYLNVVGLLGSATPQSTAAAACYVEILSTTQIRITPTLPQLSSIVNFEVWEYVGPTGGPNEFLVKGSFNGKHGAGGIGIGLPNPQGGVDIDDWLLRPGIVVPRGISFEDGTPTSFPNAVQYRIQNEKVFGVVDVFRFLRGNIAPDPDRGRFHATIVEFTGENWLVQDILQTDPVPGTTSVETISDVGSWDNAFIWAERIGNANLCNNFGMVVRPGTSTTTVRVDYPAGAQTGSAPFNAFQLRVVSNPRMSVVHAHSLGGGGIMGAPAGAGAAQNNPQLQVWDIAADFDLDASATFFNAYNSLGVAQSHSEIWSVMHSKLNPSTHRFNGARSRAYGACQLSIQLVSFDFSIPAPSVFFDIEVDQDPHDVALETAQIDVEVASSQAEVPVATDTATLALAASQSDLELPDDTYDLVVASGTLGTADGDDMPTFNLCPVELDVCITRGDSRTFAFRLVDSDGAAVPITGDSFLLSVNSLEEPPDITTQIAQLTGTIIDGPNGIVGFSPLTTTFATPGDYFYDLQQTLSGGGIFTAAKGAFTVRQDITK